MMNRQVSGRFGGALATLLLTAFLLSGTPGCAVTPQATATSAATSRDTVSAATAKWAVIFADDNPDAILALYDDEGVLWGTLSPVMLAGKPAVRGYFERAYKALPDHR
jgi:hypothetical protein